MNGEMTWTEVKRTVAAARFRALATVDEDGEPRVTPIGSVVLTAEGRGFYFEDDAAVLPGGLERAQELAILAVGGEGSWLRRVLRGALPPGPALRIKVRAGRRRAATAAERTLRLAGAGLVGRSVRFVREFTVQGVTPVHLGAMLK
ncbi:pyridoxamine 5'-phosphate oxidase family protein [Desulfocurvus sp.]|uniref:pyridoxamine 5'-phosphate oxidase family protein n=1 Tax=Desulfocurvus sp. TaxID=2871698 RepID=UPI0025C49A35|nr:pyridoxamine 5'-phosphate oxidase family protein [Desulfocurvus sp.]MCK9241241.1 pyridoxamine 5'-phosphate oxidase family protein [Desulfocurvus sp.]